MEALTDRINEAEERASNIKGQMRENKETEKKRDNNYWITRAEFER